MFHTKMGKKIIVLLSRFLSTSQGKSRSTVREDQHKEDKNQTSSQSLGPGNDMNEILIPPK